MPDCTAERLPSAPAGAGGPVSASPEPGSDGTAERQSCTPAPAGGPPQAPPRPRPDGTGKASPAPEPADRLAPVPGPPGERVLAAARLRLASRYHISDVQTPQELRARLVRDARAVSAVIAEAAAGQAADPLDVSDALVLLRSLRSYLSGLEAGLLDGAEQAGLSPGRAAACLGMTAGEVHYRRSVLRSGRPA
jgi:hypothetical protein